MKNKQGDCTYKIRMRMVCGTVRPIHRRGTINRGSLFVHPEKKKWKRKGRPMGTFRRMWERLKGKRGKKIEGIDEEKDAKKKRRKNLIVLQGGTRSGKEFLTLKKNRRKRWKTTEKERGGVDTYKIHAANRKNWTLSNGW